MILIKSLLSQPLMGDDNNFLVLAITAPYFFEGEAERIIRILREEEANYVHIRKPGATKNQIADLIKTIPSLLHNRLKLHDHFELIEKYQLGGIHLNSRNPEPYKGAKSISKSAHSFEEISSTNCYDYITLSPIFDSISKVGYNTHFNQDEIKKLLNGCKNIIALGGVTPDKFPLLKSLGFAGAALLGYFFPSFENQQSQQ